MKASSLRQHKKKQDQLQQIRSRGCSRALCCSCRLSVSSSEEAESTSSDRFASVSSLAHAMVQERLEQMIRERQEVKTINSNVAERRRQRVSSSSDQGTSTKFVLMVAMEKCSYDIREDFRESMVEMIMANRIGEPKDLRSLLNYYVSMNSDEYHGIILEVFHEVCSRLFLSCKGHY
ncbi:probable transcription repressor OFP9 [Humulus lupulus]|uniref:probable transcription repressor OFP9 n=1 Tax=Humulus lupulus TaxID=3486 RepID=UPI002B40A9D8|nr:probable transcription repressor OFP9 [Humulus lupulus]